MRLNVFRNPFIDVQVSMILDNFDQAIRNQTEEYWRTVIAEEIRDACRDYQAWGVTCIDCIDTIEIIWRGRK